MEWATQRHTELCNASCVHVGARPVEIASLQVHREHRRAQHHRNAEVAVTKAPALATALMKWSPASAAMPLDRCASRTHKKYSPSFRDAAAPRIASTTTSRCSSSGLPTRIKHVLDETSWCA